MAIDRRSLVTRHNIRWDDPTGRVALGNGEFCFGADGTGLQTFAGNCMSHWGWHSFPLPYGWTPELVPPTGTFQQGRNTRGDHFPPATEAVRAWMFDNPHIMNLGRLRLVRGEHRHLLPEEIKGLERTLDLWTGLQTSRYQIDGQDVTVETCVHPSLDLVAVRIESALVTEGGLQAALDFGYPSLTNNPWVGEFARYHVGHTTEAQRASGRRLDLRRDVDAMAYHVAMEAAPGCDVLEPDLPPGFRRLAIVRADYGTGDRRTDVTARLAAAVNDNRLTLAVTDASLGAVATPGTPKSLRVAYTVDGVSPDGIRAEQTVEIPENRVLRLPPHQGAYRISTRGGRALCFVCAFASEPLPSVLPDFAATRAACAARWQSFWQSGGAIDLSASRDARWKELERRVVLSQYQLAAQSAGSWCPSEMGLLGIDPWNGQFHMEMLWWHLAHYALWDRWEMADRAVRCYHRFAPVARQLAAQLDYKGLKWGKMVGPEGRTAPWVGSQVLLWKQPHPIFFAELEYRIRPTRATLEQWAAIVEGTAEHMADYLTRDANTGIYHLDPAMPPSEGGITRDTVFDLAYWRWGLDKAQQWRQRLGRPREAHWEAVRRNLAPLPVADGVFVHSADWTDTYTNRAVGHPDPIGVLGMLPPTAGVDAAIAKRTVSKIWATWDRNQLGTDHCWTAMAAARTGQPEMAIGALLRDVPGNRYDRQGMNDSGIPYLPGNGGLLYAVAMMAAGWDDAPERNAPGFPDGGNWTVQWECLLAAP